MSENVTYHLRVTVHFDYKTKDPNEIAEQEERLLGVCEEFGLEPKIKHWTEYHEDVLELVTDPQQLPSPS